VGIIPVSNRTFTGFAVYRFGGVVPIQIAIVAVTVFIVWVLLRKMSFGRYVEAIGDNRSASLFSGVRITSITIMMYMFSTFLAAMAGVLETSRIAASDAQTIGMTMEMDAVASTVIGGTPLSGGRPRVVGTMIGVFIMQLITITVNMNNIPYEYSLIIKAIIIVVAIFIQKSDRNR
jgi:ribose/xylose/arabinose/galactoside ABC-type transport system permease subunit